MNGTTSSGQCSHRIGMPHFGVVCDNCHQEPIPGTRWKCRMCPDYDLCSNCYKGMIHDQHGFWKIVAPSAERIERGPRGRGMHHIGVRCDNCDEEPIAGTRFKCRGCLDYDLCLDCYEAMIHKEHDFWKIDSSLSEPIEASPRRQGELFAGTPHYHVQCDRCHEEPVVGTRWKCRSCPDYDLCSDCYKDMIHTEHGFWKLQTPSSSRIEARPRVPGGIVTGIHHLHVRCDVCGEEPIIDTRWKCRECLDYDLCTNCYKSNNHIQHGFYKIKTPSSTRIFAEPRNQVAPTRGGFNNFTPQSMIPPPLPAKRVQNTGSTNAVDPSAPTVSELTKRLEDVQDIINCNICFENQRSVVFGCGHLACSECAERLNACHMCRKKITVKIPFYN